MVSPYNDRSRDGNVAKSLGPRFGGETEGIGKIAMPITAPQVWPYRHFQDDSNQSVIGSLRGPTEPPNALNASKVQSPTHKKVLLGRNFLVSGV